MINWLRNMTASSESLRKKEEEEEEEEEEVTYPRGHSICVDWLRDARDWHRKEYSYREKHKEKWETEENKGKWKLMVGSDEYKYVLFRWDDEVSRYFRSSKYDISKREAAIVVNAIERYESMPFEYFSRATGKFECSSEGHGKGEFKGEWLLNLERIGLDRKDDRYKVYSWQKSRGYYTSNAFSGAHATRDQAVRYVQEQERINAIPDLYWDDKEGEFK